MKIFLAAVILISCKTQKAPVSQATISKNGEVTEKETISYEVDQGYKDDLYDAITAQDIDLIAQNLQRTKTLSLNKFDRTGSSPLTHFLIVSAESEIEKVPLVKKFLRAGADPNFRTSMGLSPLSIAIQNNEIEVVKVLLKYGADTEEVLNDGRNLKELAKSLNRVDILKLID